MVRTQCSQRQGPGWGTKIPQAVQYNSQKQKDQRVCSLSPVCEDIVRRLLLLLSFQSCPTLCDPIPGILQARTLEWAAISFSNA